MKFNFRTNELFTDKGKLIKKMHCPLKVKWSDLEPSKEASTFRNCSNCAHQVIDTRHFSDDELLKMIQKDAGTCFKVSLNQANVEFILDV